MMTVPTISEEQARAILELRLARLTALGRDEIGDELNKIGAEISEYLEILSSRLRIMQIVKDELGAIRDEFGTPRRSRSSRAVLIWTMKISSPAKTWSLPFRISATSSACR